MERWASPYLAAQAAYLRHLGTAPVAEVVERGGVYAVRTGIASNTENGVVSACDVPVAEVVARETLAWMNERALPASWLCAEGEGLAETARVLEAAGCEPESAAWEACGVIDELALDRFAAPDAIRVTAVASERELDAWLDVAGGCGWFDTQAGRVSWKNLHLGLGGAPSAPSRLYVAFRGDMPVAMASAFLAGEIVLLTAVGVLVHERRRGVGRLLALTRLRDARESGCTIAVLAPSPDGAKLYNALGFETHQQPGDRWFYLPMPTRSGGCRAGHSSGNQALGAAQQAASAGDWYERALSSESEC